MRSKSNHAKSNCITVLTLSFSMLMAATALAKDKLPETTKDGLQLKQDTKVAAVYLKPGETLKGYDKVSITDVYVAFKKNWQRDYNRDTMSLDGHVSDKDVEVIKKRLAKEFKTVFTKELQEKGGYEVVDTAAKDVLILRPGIINLVVNAPDVNRAGMGRTFVASAGEMTLYMELYDSLTSDKIAQVIDAQAAGDYGIGHSGNRASNKADFDRVLAKWADILRKQLDNVNSVAADNK
jgi:hypothetical protein